MGSEWSLVFFTSFVDLGCGLFVALAINEWFSINPQVRWRGAIAVLVALALGGLSSVLHLGHPERIFGAFSHPTSGIFIESSMIAITGICVLAYIFALKRNASHQNLKLITLIGAIPAVILAFAVGDSYVMASRPAWDTLVLPFAYLGSAAVLGCFAYRILVVSPSEHLVTQLKLLTQGLLVIQAVLMVAYLVALSNAPYSDVSRSATQVLMGGFSALFWGGIVIVGLLIPFGLTTLKKESVAPVMSATLGLVCVFIGAAAFRVLMFNLGSTVWQFF